MIYQQSPEAEGEHRWGKPKENMGEENHKNEWSLLEKGRRTALVGIGYVRFHFLIGQIHCTGGKKKKKKKRKKNKSKRKTRNAQANYWG